MTKRSVGEISAWLKTAVSLDDPLIVALRDDKRKGVHRALVQLERRLAKHKAMLTTFQQRFFYENQLWTAGNRYLAGIDEVGRGALAGPVVTCAVILDASFDLLGVTDSKQLTRQDREQLYLKIVDEAVEVSLAVNSAATIDQLNIYAATQQAMIRAVQSLHHCPDHLIVDAVPLDVSIPQTTLIKGDQKSISIAAASIVAKEYRDHLMGEYDRVYPGYGFAHNVGYGTKTHLAGLALHGVTAIHRRTFRPVSSYLK